MLRREKVNIVYSENNAHYNDENYEQFSCKEES